VAEPSGAVRSSGSNTHRWAYELSLGTIPGVSGVSGPTTANRRRNAAASEAGLHAAIAAQKTKGKARRTRPSSLVAPLFDVKN